MSGLVAAGLLDPVAAGRDAGAVLGRREAERLYEAARLDLERTTAEFEAARAALAARDEEVRYLRKTLTNAMGSRRAA